MANRVAITGFGAVTPVGNDAETTWKSLVAGRSGVRKIDTFDAETFPVDIAGLVEDFDLSSRLPDPHARRHLSRAAGFAVAAALEALDDSGVGGDTYAPEEKGIAVGGAGVRRSGARHGGCTHRSGRSISPAVQRPRVPDHLLGGACAGRAVRRPLRSDHA